MPEDICSATHVFFGERPARCPRPEPRGPEAPSPTTRDAVARQPEAPSPKPKPEARTWPGAPSERGRDLAAPPLAAPSPPREGTAPPLALEALQADEAGGDAWARRAAALFEVRARRDSAVVCARVGAGSGPVGVGVGSDRVLPQSLTQTPRLTLNPNPNRGRRTASWCCQPGWRRRSWRHSPRRSTARRAAMAPTSHPKPARCEAACIENPSAAPRRPPILYPTQTATPAPTPLPTPTPLLALRLSLLLPLTRRGSASTVRSA